MYNEHEHKDKVPWHLWQETIMILFVWENSVCLTSPRLASHCAIHPTRQSCSNAIFYNVNIVSAPTE